MIPSLAGLYFIECDEAGKVCNEGLIHCTVADQQGTQVLVQYFGSQRARVDLMRLLPLMDFANIIPGGSQYWLFSDKPDDYCRVLASKSSREKD
jgi:hypothetical protein